MCSVSGSVRWRRSKGHLAKQRSPAAIAGREPFDSPSVLFTIYIFLWNWLAARPPELLPGA